MQQHEELRFPLLGGEFCKPGSLPEENLFVLCCLDLGFEKTSASDGSMIHYYDY